MENLTEDIALIAQRGDLTAIPGIGKDLAQKINEVLTTGTLKKYEELKKEIPPGLVEFLNIPGVGPRTAKVLYEKLGVKSLEELERLAQEHRPKMIIVGASAYPREIDFPAFRRIADAILGSLNAAGERLAFISKWDEHRDGLDITVGSQRLGREIASGITQTLGGSVSTHPKLVGEKAGKQIFRVTYSVRLPRYSRGDILVVRGKYVEVIGIEGRLFRCIDIESGTTRLFREGQIERRAGRREDSTLWQVIFRDRDLLGLMDPSTGITREVLVPAKGVFPPGAGVHVFFDGERPVILP